MSYPLKGFKVGYNLKKTKNITCNTCPTECGKTSILFENTKKIDKIVGTTSSSHLYKKKAIIINTFVGEGANPKNALQAGGPGDLWSSACKGNNCGGVDKKHNSYDRYLARKVGGVLRNEKSSYNSKNNLTGCLNNKCCNRIPLNCSGCNGKSCGKC
jgi:hypothetical protein